MWSRSYSSTVTGVARDRLWAVWADVDRWHTWQDDIAHARLEGAFATGSRLRFKPKGGPELALELVEVREGESFTDVVRLPLARMYDRHDLIDHGDAVEIRQTVRIVGPLAWAWRRMVGEGIVAGLPAQTDRLVARARGE